MCVAPQPDYTGTIPLMKPLVRDLVTGREPGDFVRSPIACYEIPKFILFLPALPKGVTEGSGPASAESNKGKSCNLRILTVTLSARSAVRSV